MHGAPGKPGESRGFHLIDRQAKKVSRGDTPAARQLLGERRHQRAVARAAAASVDLVGLSAMTDDGGADRGGRQGDQRRLYIFGPLVARQ